MSDLIDRQAAIDALDEIEAEVADGYGYQYAKWREYFCDLPPVTQKQSIEALKAEIKRMKRTFTICINPDYYTGYMSALSAVEGYIAQSEGDAE